MLLTDNVHEHDGHTLVLVSQRGVVQALAMAGQEVIHNVRGEHVFNHVELCLGHELHLDVELSTLRDLALGDEQDL